MLCLRFDQVIANVGERPVDLRFAIPHHPASTERTPSSGSTERRRPLRRRPRRRVEFHPIHDHYHFTGFARRLELPRRERQRDGRRTQPSGRAQGQLLRADTDIDYWGEKGDGSRT